MGTFSLKKPIRLIELFAGYGSQALSLEYLGANFESWKISEWNFKSFSAYNDLHYQDRKDYSKDLSREEIVKFLFDKGISRKWSEPMTLEQIKRIPEKKIRKIYNDFIATKNLGSVTQIKGKDLEIIDTDKFDYVLTYSFPCQDLSAAGLRKGMKKNSGTRSGLLWEVERILNELDNKPQVLLMENVPLVHGKKNLKPFNEWLNALEEMGYKNYWEDLNAKDYGVPQNRRRCFMVSILEEEKYEFPPKEPLNLKLKDMLEDKVDEKYYLSDTMTNYIFSGNDKYIVNKNNMVLNRDIACCKTTREGSTRCDASDYISPEFEDTENYVQWKKRKKLEIEYSKYSLKKIKSNIENSKGDIAGTITVNSMQSINHDNCQFTFSGFDVNTGKPEKRFFKQAFETFEENNCGKFDTIDAFNKKVNKTGISPTLTTRPEGFKTAILPIDQNLRIRKLTPRECFRLMGVKDKDFEKITASNSVLYHLAGDSIVVNVLMAIFKQML